MKSIWFFVLIVVLSHTQCNNKVSPNHIAVELPPNFFIEKAYHNYPILVLTGLAKNNYGSLNRDAIIYNLETSTSQMYSALLKDLGKQERLHDKKNSLRVVYLSNHNQIYFSTSWNRLFKLDKQKLKMLDTDLFDRNSMVVSNGGCLYNESIFTLSQEDILDRSMKKAIPPGLFLSRFDLSTGKVLKKDISEYFTLDELDRDYELSYVGKIGNDIVVWIHDRGCIKLDHDMNNVELLDLSIQDVMNEMGLPIWSPKNGHDKYDYVDVKEKLHKPYLLHVEPSHVFFKAMVFNDKLQIIKKPLLGTLNTEKVEYPQGTLMEFIGFDQFAYAKSNKDKDSLFIRIFSWDELKSGIHKDFRTDLDTISDLYQNIDLTPH